MKKLSFIDRQLNQFFDSVYVILLSDKWLSDWSQKLQIADVLSLFHSLHNTFHGMHLLKDNITNGKDQMRKQLKINIYIYIKVTCIVIPFFKTYQAPVYSNCVFCVLNTLWRRLTMHTDSDMSVYLKYIMLLTFTTATLIITKYQNTPRSWIYSTRAFIYWILGIHTPIIEDVKTLGFSFPCFVGGKFGEPTQWNK